MRNRYLAAVVSLVSLIACGRFGLVDSSLSIQVRIDKIEPASGTTFGGDVLVVTGQNFEDGAAVTMDGMALTYSVVSPEVLRVTTRPHPAGSAQLTVQLADGRTGSSCADCFQFVQPPPRIDRITPARGATRGGTQVEISGDNFEAPLQAMFGDSEATVLSVERTRVVVTTPPHGYGPVDVALLPSAAGPAATRAAGFAYFADQLEFDPRQLIFDRVVNDLLVVDVDQDGDDDLVYLSEGVLVQQRQDAPGVFGAASELTWRQRSATRVNWPLRTDWDGDGRDDILVESGGGVVPLLAEPGGGFVETAPLDLSGTCEHAERLFNGIAGDFDGDGFADLIVCAGGGWGEWGVRFGAGGSALREYRMLHAEGVPGDPRYLARGAVDLDGNGADELVVAVDTIGGVQFEIWSHLADASMQVVALPYFGSGSFSVETLDINADGLTDLLLAGPEMVLFTQRPDGTFEPAANAFAGQGRRADFDRSARLDAAFIPLYDDASRELRMFGPYACGFGGTTVASWSWYEYRTTARGYRLANEPRLVAVLHLGGDWPAAAVAYEDGGVELVRHSDGAVTTGWTLLDDTPALSNLQMIDLDGAAPLEMVQFSPYRTPSDPFRYRVLRRSSGAWVELASGEIAPTGDESMVVAYFEPFRAADVDGDGDRDLVWPVGATVYLMRAADDGSFNPPEIVHQGAVGTDPMLTVGLCDVDGDGSLDIGVNTGILRNRASGFVLQPAPVGIPIASSDLVDVDGDGRCELVANLGHPLGPTAVLRAGDSATLEHLQSLDLLAAEEFAFGTFDVDDDGQADLLSYDADGLYYRRGGPAGFALDAVALDSWLDRVVGEQAVHLLRGDVDGDQTTDLLLLWPTASSNNGVTKPSLVTIFRRDSAGQLSKSREAIYNLSGFAQLVDVDGDGRDDLVDKMGCCNYESGGGMGGPGPVCQQAQAESLVGYAKNVSY